MVSANPVSSVKPIKLPDTLFGPQDVFPITNWFHVFYEDLPILHTTMYILVTTMYILQCTYYILHTTYYILHTKKSVYCVLRTTYCRCRSSRASVFYRGRYHQGRRGEGGGWGRRSGAKIKTRKTGKTSKTKSTQAIKMIEVIKGVIVIKIIEW